MFFPDLIYVVLFSLTEIRQKHFEEQSLYSLFQNVTSESLFDFLKASGVCYQKRCVVAIFAWNVFTENWSEIEFCGFMTCKLYNRETDRSLFLPWYNPLWLTRFKTPTNLKPTPLIWLDMIFSQSHTCTPQWGAADAEIKVPSGENTELKRSRFKTWSRSVYSHTCYVYCQRFLPCLCIPFQSIRLHFYQNLSRFFLCWL